MNDDIETILNQLTPRGAGPELRARVLDAVAERLGAAGSVCTHDREESCGAGFQPVTEHGQDGRATRNDANTFAVPDPSCAVGSLPALARRRWDRWAVAAVAALLLLGVGLNFWVARTGQAQLAAIYGPQPVPRYIADIADTIASVTDAETGRRVREQLLAAQPSRRITPEDVMRHYEQLLNTILLVERDLRHGATQEDTEMDRNRSRDAGGDTSYYQRRLGPDHRFTA